MRVLLVEDDQELASILQSGFKDQRIEAVPAPSFQDASRKASLAQYTVIIIDVMIPGGNGFDLCRKLRERGDTTPILMLTAKGSVEDRVTGLEAGADDYLTKPFSMRELMARVKAQMRRSRLLREELGKSKETGKHQEKLTFDNLIVNLTRREVMLNDEPLALKPQEYELLVFFAEHKGQMLSREFVLERVWGWDFIGDSRTVDVHVRWLRQKIEDDPGKPKRIVTVRGGGYRFEG